MKIVNIIIFVLGCVELAIRTIVAAVIMTVAALIYPLEVMEEKLTGGKKVQKARARIALVCCGIIISFFKGDLRDEIEEEVKLPLDVLRTMAED